MLPILSALDGLIYVGTLCWFVEVWKFHVKNKLLAFDMKFPQYMSGNTVETTSGNCFQQILFFVGKFHVRCQLIQWQLVSDMKFPQTKEGAHLPGEISCQMPDNYVITGIWH